MATKQTNKQTKTIYPEFSDDSATWRNYPRPAIDQSLVKELENIARLPDGRPRYRVRWGCECYLDLADEVEYNSGGLPIGIERGGRLHQYSLAVWEQTIGYSYREAGVMKFTEKAEDVPDGIISTNVREIVSIGVPRFIVEEFQDRSYHPVMGDGDYYRVWTVEDITQTGETETEVIMTSRRREFSRFDVENAKNLFNLRRRLTPAEIHAGIKREQERKTKLKAEKEAAEKADWSETTDKFFTDKEYKEKSKSVTVTVPDNLLNRAQEDLLAPKKEKINA